MGQIRPHPPVKLIMGLILAPGCPHARLWDTLRSHFGPIDFASELLPFDYTDYYRREMGSPLQRQFLSFERLIPPESLVPIKQTTNAIETEYADAMGHRRVNLDPGYVTLAKLVLASTKDHAHRIWLGGGIYAEMTLRYHNRSFQPWEWTYPDYRTSSYIQIFNHIRRLYLRQWRHLSQEESPPSG